MLRRLTHIKRIGFAGTLDPLATGLMIFAIGEATKMLTFLEKMDKVYKVTIHLGATSDTYDAKGKITSIIAENDHVFSEKITHSLIEKILEEEFLGEREQMPPIFSAIQINGKRAYDLARKGKEVKLKMRPVHFFDLKVKAFAWPLLELEVHCGSGTYVRSLAHDLGQRLGCGGYVEELRRVKIGHFKVAEAVKFEQLDLSNVVKFMRKPEEFFDHFQQVVLTESEYTVLANGGFIPNKKIVQGVPILAMYALQCVGVLETFLPPSRNPTDVQQLKFSKKFNIV